jgi:hypothetical protein
MASWGSEPTRDAIETDISSGAPEIQKSYEWNWLGRRSFVRGEYTRSEFDSHCVTTNIIKVGIWEALDESVEVINGSRAESSEVDDSVLDQQCIKLLLVILHPFFRFFKADSSSLQNQWESTFLGAIMLLILVRINSDSSIEIPSSQFTRFGTRW